jgi:hypothetical protein
MSQNIITDIRFEVVTTQTGGPAQSIDAIIDLIRFQEGAPTVSPQNLWLSFKDDSGNLAIAENNTDQLTLAGGSNLSTSISSKTVTFDVDDNPTFHSLVTTGETEVRGGLVVSGDTLSGFYAQDGELLLTVDPSTGVQIQTGRSIIPDNNNKNLSLGGSSNIFSGVWAESFYISDNSGTPGDAVIVTAPSNVFPTSPDPVYNIVLPETTGGTGTFLGVYDYGASTSTAGPSDRAMNTSWFSLLAGTNVTLDTSYAASGSSITINSTSGAETNTASNVGVGTGIFSGKSGTDLQFYSISGGTNVDVTLNNNTLVIDSTASGSALTVKEVDGSPTVNDVTTIEFTNGTVSDQGSGVVRVTVSGGTGSGTGVNDETKVFSWFMNVT